MIDVHCNYCGSITDEVKIVRENGSDFLACYTCRQYRHTPAKAIQALERKDKEASYASI